MSADTYKIERLGHKGDGVASGPVFVHRSLPGEVVGGDVVDGRIARPRIVTPSTDRVSPPCRHYKSCGGCGLQHARDEFVANWKQQIVRDALSANDLAADIRGLHTSPARSRRRAVFSATRTKSGAIVGFHGAQSETITAVSDCVVITKNLRDAIPLLEQATILGGSRKAEIKYTVTDTEEGIDVDATGGHEPDVALRLRLSELVARTPIARLTWNGEQIVQKVLPRVSFDGVSAPFPPGAFMQATREGEEAIRASVVEALEGCKGPIVDLFAGLGTFSLPLAKHFEVHAVEGEASLTEALEAGWRHAKGLRQVTVETRDLFRRPLLPDELNRFAGIVLDPPRAGAAAQIAEIARSNVSVVVHVSCNPVTFARDAAKLTESGYDLVWIDVVDQFRWSSHTELVSLFKRKKS